MKDYEIEELEGVYGDLMEEILAEVFCHEVEDELIDGRSIYDISSDDDVEKRIARELMALNEGSAGVEDLEILEVQAKSYFDEPKHVFTPEEEEPVEWITGFVQISSGIKFDSNGEAVEAWRSFGAKIVCEAEILYSPDEIVRRVERTGIQWMEGVRVVFYGKGLEKYVGHKIYKTGEKKQLVPLCNSFERMLLAVPSYEECNTEGSIFSCIDGLVKEAVQYGGELDIDRVTMGHYEMTLARIEELRQAELDLAEDKRIQSFQRKSVERRNNFDAHFKEAREAIKGLNQGSLKINQLSGRDARFFSRIIYLCQKGERIENPALFFQVKALVNKRKCEEMQQSPEALKAIKLISRVNAGEDIEVHLLGVDELELVFNVLWSGTGIRINNEYKDVYFELKERFSLLKKGGKRAA